MKNENQVAGITLHDVIQQLLNNQKKGIVELYHALQTDDISFFKLMNLMNGNLDKNTEISEKLDSFFGMESGFFDKLSKFTEDYAHEEGFEATDKARMNATVRSYDFNTLAKFDVSSMKKKIKFESFVTKPKTLSEAFLGGWGAMGEVFHVRFEGIPDAVYGISATTPAMVEYFDPPRHAMQIFLRKWNESKQNTFVLSKPEILPALDPVYFNDVLEDWISQSIIILRIKEKELNKITRVTRTLFTQINADRKDDNPRTLPDSLRVTMSDDMVGFFQAPIELVDSEEEEDD